MPVTSPWAQLIITSELCRDLEMETSQCPDAPLINKLSPPAAGRDCCFQREGNAFFLSALCLILFVHHHHRAGVSLWMVLNTQVTPGTARKISCSTKGLCASSRAGVCCDFGVRLGASARRFKGEVWRNAGICVPGRGLNWQLSSNTCH